MSFSAWITTNKALVANGSGSSHFEGMFDSIQRSYEDCVAQNLPEGRDLEAEYGEWFSLTDSGMNTGSNDWMNERLSAAEAIVSSSGDFGSGIEWFWIPDGIGT